MEIKEIAPANLSPPPVPRWPEELAAPERLYFQANEYFQDLLSTMASAEKSIDIEMYIWADDSFGLRLQKELELAAKRGVQIRVIVDGVGSHRWIQTQLPVLQSAGVSVRVYHPTFWPSSFLRFHWGRMLFCFAHINSRDHRKTFIIDGKIAFIGSANIMNQAFLWRETGLRITSPTLQQIQNAFEETWISEIGSNLARHGIMHSKRFLSSKRALKAKLLQRIFYAKERVWIMTPYFVPPTSLVRALRRSAKRGLEVRLILPARSDIAFLRWIARLYYQVLLKAGVQIYEYRPQVLHAKMTLIDDWGVIGSSNVNHRSFYHDLELDFALSTEEALIALERQFILDMARSEKIARFRFQGWRYWTARFLSLFKALF